MKKTIFAVMLAAASMTAQAAWHVGYENDDGSIGALAPSIPNGVGAVLAVMFYPSLNCVPTLSYTIIVDYDKSMEKGPSQTVEIPVKWRIDSNDTTWEVDEIQISYSENVITYGIAHMNKESIGELMAGSIARIKIQLPGEDAWYDSFNLHGSAKAISKARTMCKPTSDYFTTPQPTEDAKYFRGA